MSTTSPNFNLLLATGSDTVNVTSHISNNFSTLDSILSVVHTGTGVLKSNLTFVTPHLNSPVMSGIVSGASVVIATTGSFQTITATGGAVTLNTLNVGTYSYPSTIGNTSYILTVVTGNAQWAASSPNTGANQALSNLAAVAINTNMNTFTGGFVTLARLIVTSGGVTGLTSFQATAGTFAGLVTALGTVNANVVNCTGGSITAGAVTIGTYALPAVLGSTGQVFRVSDSTLGYSTPITGQFFRSIISTGSAGIGSTGSTVSFDAKDYDSVSQFNTSAFSYTITASGYYSFGCDLLGTGSGAAGYTQLTLVGSAGASSYLLGGVYSTALANTPIAGNVLVKASAGHSFTISVTAPGAAGFTYNAGAGAFWGYRVAETFLS